MVTKFLWWELTLYKTPVLEYILISFPIYIYDSTTIGNSHLGRRALVGSWRRLGEDWAASALPRPLVCLRCWKGQHDIHWFIFHYTFNYILVHIATTTSMPEVLKLNKLRIFQKCQAVLCHILIDKHTLENVFYSNIAPSLSSVNHFFLQDRIHGAKLPLSGLTGVL